MKPDVANGATRSALASVSEGRHPMADSHAGAGADPSDGRLEAERHAIMAGSRLRWFHWVVVALSVSATLIAWQVTERQLNDKFENRFETDAEQVVSLVEERMARYEDGLWSGVAALTSLGGDASREEWSRFANTLQIDTKYPGINGIGVVHHVEPADLALYLAEQRATLPDYALHPATNNGEYLPITYIEPSESNMAAVGLDLSYEANRYLGLQRARDTGEARLTAPIVLVQDEGQTPGFLLYAPFYDAGDPGSLGSRQERFSGAVYAPFVASQLLHGVLGQESRAVAISIADGDDVLYDEHTPGEEDFDPDPLFQRSISVEMYGRTWDFDVRSTMRFRDAAAHNEPKIILLGGLMLEVTLLVLFLSLSRSNRRAIRYADEVTGELRNESARLQESNSELERFVYVASHDLKTPLRGLSHLTEYLEDDLEQYLASPDANPDVPRNLTRMHQQLGLMSDLLSGILDYSRVGGETEATTSDFDVLGHVERLRADLNLAPEQLVYSGPAHALVPAAAYFERILQNLITNAAVHHNSIATAVIEVRVEQNTNRVVLSVSDNGPGIASEYHDRVFDMCQRLPGAGSGTGIGLAVVRKIVTNRGGQIRLDSAVGRGATFAVKWPMDSGASEQTSETSLGAYAASAHQEGTPA